MGQKVLSDPLKGGEGISPFCVRERVFLAGSLHTQQDAWSSLTFSLWISN